MHVAEVDVGAEALDEPDLLRALRRLEDQAIDVDLVRDLVDEAGADLAVGAVHAGRPVGPALADDLGRAGLERLADELDPAVGRHERARVLLADLGVHGAVAGKGPYQVELLLARHRHDAARDLDVLDPELVEPAPQPVDLALQPRELCERAAEHRRNAEALVEVEL